MPDQPPAPLTLSPTQYAIVVELARDGADDQTIADRLHVARNSVSSRLAEVRALTGHTNRTALTVALLRGHVAFRTNYRKERAR